MQYYDPGTDSNKDLGNSGDSIHNLKSTLFKSNKQRLLLLLKYRTTAFFIMFQIFTFSKYNVTIVLTKRKYE